MDFQLRPCQGQFPTGKHIIYVSADEEYYNKFVRSLVHSVLRQIDWIFVHVHVVCNNVPPADTIKNDRLTLSYEIIDQQFIDSIKLDQSPKRIAMNEKILNTNDVGQIKRKIYYSCARFLRMADLFGPDQYVLQIDADSILNLPFDQLSFETVTRVPRAMRKPKDWSTLMAGCLGLGTGSVGENFKQQFKANLLESFNTGVYWFVDQQVLKDVFSGTAFEPIDILWCSWGNKRDMHFFTAKGDKKNQADFLRKVEQWRD